MRHSHKQEMELLTCACTSFHFCQLITDHWRGRTSFLSSEINILYFLFFIFYFLFFYFLFYFLFSILFYFILFYSIYFFPFVFFTMNHLLYKWGLAFWMDRFCLVFACLLSAMLDTMIARVLAVLPVGINFSLSFNMQ